LYGQQVVPIDEGDANERKPDAAPAAGEPEQIYAAARDDVQFRLRQLEHLQVPRLFVGARPYLIGAAVIIISVVATQLIVGGASQFQSFSDFKTLKPAWPAVGYAFGGALVGLLILGILLRM